MNNHGEDEWHIDANVLQAVSDLERTLGRPASVGDIAKLTDFDAQTVMASLTAQDGIHVRIAQGKGGWWRRGETMRVLGLTERGRRLSGQWPDRVQHDDLLFRHAVRPPVRRPLRYVVEPRWATGPWRLPGWATWQNAAVFLVIGGAIASGVQWIVWRAFFLQLGVTSQDVASTYLDLVIPATVATISIGAVCIAHSSLALFLVVHQIERVMSTTCVPLPHDRKVGSKLWTYATNSAYGYAVFLWIIWAAVAVLWALGLPTTLAVLVAVFATYGWTEARRPIARRIIALARAEDKPLRRTQQQQIFPIFATLMGITVAVFLVLPWYLGASQGKLVAQGKAPDVPPLMSLLLPDITCVEATWIGPSSTPEAVPDRSALRLLPVRDAAVLYEPGKDGRGAVHLPASSVYLVDRPMQDCRTD